MILLTCFLFLLVSVLHFIACSSIDTPLYWFGLGLLFTTAFSVYAGFWPTVACIRGFLAKRRVHTQLFFIQSRTSSLLVSLMLWEVVGWVVSVVGSSLGLMLSVGCFFCDQRPFFIDFSLKVVLVIFPFCFAISALLFLSWCLVGILFDTCCRD